MSSNFLEVEPNLIWQNDKQTKHARKITEFKPWTRRQEIPGFDYKTSHQVALPYVFQFNRFVETPDLTKMQERDSSYRYEELRNHYKTITGTSYSQKFPKTEPGESSSFFNNFETLNYLLRTKDFMVQSDLTEYSKTYKWHTYDPNIFGEYKDHTNEILCKSPKIFKNIQPSFETYEGVLKEKDIYKSQTHFVHHYISPVKVKVANETLGGGANIKVYSNPNPIDPPLRLPFRQVYLPKKTSPVPHRGMISESKENYTKQVDFFALTDTVGKSEKFVFDPSLKEDMIKEMNKYFTNYEDIGHNCKTTKARKIALFSRQLISAYKIKYINSIIKYMRGLWFGARRTVPRQTFTFSRYWESTQEDCLSGGENHNGFAQHHTPPST